MAHANEELLRSTTAALNSGDMEGFLAGHTPHVKFHVPGKGPFSGDHNWTASSRRSPGRAPSVASDLGRVAALTDRGPSPDGQRWR